MPCSTSRPLCLSSQCCSECPEPRLAQSLCTFCNKWLCFQCTDLHQHERTSAAPPAESRHHPSSSSPTVPSEPGTFLCSTVIHHFLLTLHLCSIFDLGNYRFRYRFIKNGTHECGGFVDVRETPSHSKVQRLYYL